MLTVQLNSIDTIRPLLFAKTNISNDFITSPLSNKLFEPEILRLNPALENIRSEAGDDFLQYLQWLQLEDEPNLMTLSSTHHYYYDDDDLKNIKILLNLKPLNRIKHLNHFLQNLVRLLPQKSNFIGCFKNTIQNRSVFSFSKSSDFFQGLINYIDLRTDNTLTKREVSKLLEDNKLNVVDITDINGMTYFCSQTA